MALHLRRNEPAGTGLLWCILRQLDAGAGALLEPGGEPSDVVVHKTRQRLKKCRAGLRILRGSNADDLSRKCNIHLRDAGRALSRTRDARVALATFRRLPKRGARVREALAPLQGLLVKNTALHETAQTPARNAVKLIRTAETELRAFPDVDFGSRELSAGLTRLYRRARKAEGGWPSSDDAAHLHEWRKRIKDLYYALRLARRHCKPAGERVAGCLRDLGEITGLRLDLEVMVRVASGLADPLPGVLMKLVGVERHRLERRVKKIAHELFEQKPTEFRRNILRG